MFNTTEQFITGIKLKELRKQRELLLTAYSRLDTELAAANGDARRLQLLYQHLRQISFAGQPLHPNVANLEPVLYGAEQPDFNSSNTVSFWREQLEKELAAGRLRAEIIFLFAALLEDWTQGSNKVATDQESEQVRRRLLDRVTHPLENNNAFDPAYLDTIFERWGFDRQKDTELLQRIIAQKLPRPIDSSELRKVLTKISRDHYHSPLSRRQAQNILLNELLIKEFADALTLMLGDLDNWDWPAEGVTVRASLTPGKWRLFLNEELPEGCLLEILGSRWQKIFEEFFNSYHSSRIEQLRKLAPNLAPTERVERVLAIFRNSLGLKPSVYGEVDIWSDRARVEETDLWEDPASLETKAKQKLSLEELMGRWVKTSSIAGQRAALKGQYRDLAQIDGYLSGTNEDAQLNSMEQGISQINAEIRLGEAAFPNRPIYILKADLQDYYPVLPHSLLLGILTHLGLNEAQLKFFRRYLAVTIKDEQQVLKIHHGVPNHRRISDLLGELVLLLLDYDLQGAAQVQIIRTIDDITLIAASPQEAQKSWNALEKFCAALGLTLNTAKCGAVCIGATLPPGLPTAQPKWAILTLNSRGEWRVEPGRLTEYFEQARQQVAGAGSIISQVEVYNNCLNYLVKGLGLRIRLDISHRQSAGQALLEFQQNFFGQKRGIVEGLREQIQSRFAGGLQSTAPYVPDAWLYWPITAGGLSLNNPLIIANSFAQTFRLNFPLVAPDERSTDWQRRRNRWYDYYQNLLDSVEPASPASNAVMETLVNDFIQRGAEISLGEQDSLSTYWRWVVYLYGPQILEQLGTFRFLIAELVPAQVITRRYRQELGGDQTSVTPPF